MARKTIKRSKRSSMPQRGANGRFLPRSKRVGGGDAARPRGANGRFLSRESSAPTAARAGGGGDAARPRGANGRFLPRESSAPVKRTGGGKGNDGRAARAAEPDSTDGKRYHAFVYAASSGRARMLMRSKSDRPRYVKSSTPAGAARKAFRVSGKESNIIVTSRAKVYSHTHERDVYRLRVYVYKVKSMSQQKRFEELSMRQNGKVDAAFVKERLAALKEQIQASGVFEGKKLPQYVHAESIVRLTMIFHNKFRYRRLPDIAMNALKEWGALPRLFSSSEKEQADVVAMLTKATRGKLFRCADGTCTKPRSRT